MRENSNNQVTSNASASAFGWDFQSNAAILLMLENINNAECIKVEGKTEDIEITLSNGNIIYSQAKSLEDIDSTANLLQKLKDGIKTLNNAYEKGNSENLIYITNHANPFNDLSSIQFFTGSSPSRLPYSDLPQQCKNKISKIIDDHNYSLDVNQLKIYVLPFYGSDKDNRNKSIRDAVEDFLVQLEVRTSYNPKKILEIWQKDFFHNATIPDDTIKINKKDMLWALIVDVCNFEQNYILLENCDEGMIDEIKHRYEVIINNKSEEFLFINKILNDYSNYRRDLTNQERTKLFINKEFSQYQNEFDIDSLDKEIKDCLIKTILYRIIHRRYIIDRIKKGASL